MRGSRTLALAAALLLLGASGLEAQQRSFTVGGSLGTVFPVGELSDVYETALHFDAHVELPNVGNLPFGVRLDGGYIGFSEGNDSLRSLSGRLNAVVPFATAPDARPYLIVGLGIYNMDGDFPHDGHTDEESETLFGVNFGLGFSYRAGGLNLFVESRFHNVFEDDEALRFIPLSIGIRF